MLNKYPQQRISIKEILGHPWLLGVAPDTEYKSGIKNLALRQKIKMFFIANGIEEQHKFLPERERVSKRCFLFCAPQISRRCSLWTMILSPPTQRLLCLHHAAQLTRRFWCLPSSSSRTQTMTLMKRVNRQIDRPLLQETAYGASRRRRRD
jgi:hypothetical protein